ncbi:MAG: hypothetical protein KM310_00275 [Clostridiales bacterium]|nr:hypothetical protein [Clostridiales bacterium]
MNREFQLHGFPAEDLRKYFRKILSPYRDLADTVLLLAQDQTCGTIEVYPEPLPPLATPFLSFSYRLYRGRFYCFGVSSRLSAKPYAWHIDISQNVVDPRKLLILIHGTQRGTQLYLRLLHRKARQRFRDAYGPLAPWPLAPFSRTFEITELALTPGKPPAVFFLRNPDTEFIAFLWPDGAVITPWSLPDIPPSRPGVLYRILFRQPLPSSYLDHLENEIRRQFHPLF